MQVPKLLRQVFALLLLVATAETVWVFAATPLITSIVERREELQAKRELLGRLRSALSEAQQAPYSPTAGIDLAAYFAPGNTDTERAANLQIAICDLACQQGLRLRSSRILPPQPADAKIQTVGVEATAIATLEQLTAVLAAIAGLPFLIVYYGSDGSGGWQPLERPLRTLTTLDRFGLVTWRGKTPMLRMLQVPELVRAMGFDKSYVLPHGSRRDRIKILGNGVCPPVMEAVVRSLVSTR